METELRIKPHERLRVPLTAVKICKQRCLSSHVCACQAIKLHNFTARLRDLQKLVPFSSTKELEFLQYIFHSNLIKGLCGKLGIDQIIQYA